MQTTESAWDRFATEQSKGSIGLWLLGGVAYNVYAGEFISLSTLLLIFPGIFLASLAVIPASLINLAKVRILSSMRHRRHNLSDVAVLTLWTAWWLIDLAYPVVLAVFYLYLLHGWADSREKNDQWKFGWSS